MRKILVPLLFIVSIQTSFSQELPKLEELVKKYAPVLRHHTMETHLPSSIEWYLNKCELNKKRGYAYIPFFDKWAYSEESDVICDLSNNACQQKLSNEAKYTGSSFNETMEDRRWFISPPDSQGPLGLPLGNWQYGDLNSAKAYVQIRLAHYQTYPRLDYDIEIQYWFFWPFNPAASSSPADLGKHEGDWEGVSVVLGSSGELKYVAATKHGERNFYTSSQLEKDGTNPVLFVAKGSHALYNKNGKFHYFGSDVTMGLKGYKELKSASSYEIVAIDSRIKEHNITYTTPGWIKYGGNWGGTYDTRGIDIGFFEVSDSNSPRFPKYDQSEWDGKFDGINPIPYDYTYPKGYIEPNQISGSSSLCNGSNYRFRVNINQNKTVKWGANTNYFNFNQTDKNYFDVTAKGSGSNKSITADVDINHMIDSEIAFKTLHNFSKKVSIANPTSADFALNVNSIGSYGSTSCITSISLNNKKGAPISVRWSTSPGHSIQTSNKNYANIISPRNSGGVITAEVTTCNKTFVLSTRIFASCTGGGGIEGGIDGGFKKGDSNPVNAGELYPNPTSGTFRIVIPNSERSLKDVSIVISDNSGKTISKRQINELTGNFVNMDMSKEQNGLYLVIVYSNNKAIYQGKLIKN